MYPNIHILKYNDNTNFIVISIDESVISIDKTVAIF